MLASFGGFSQFRVILASFDGLWLYCEHFIPSTQLLLSQTGSLDFSVTVLRSTPPLNLLMTSGSTFSSGRRVRALEISVLGDLAMY